MGVVRGKYIVVLIWVMVSMTSSPSTWAIEGGKVALGENVVTFVLKNPATGKVASPPYCSGGLIAPRIVVTAKHCVANPNSNRPGQINSTWDVTFPGADILSTELKTAKVLEVIMNPGEFTDTDDIAFIVIDRDFPVPTNLKIASIEDMNQLRSVQAQSSTYGYGSTATNNFQTYLPFKIENRLVQDFPTSTFGPEVFAIQYLSPTAYICGGDSGGPNYVQSGEFWYYIGPTGFGTRPGCAKGLEGNFYSGGTAIAYKTNLLREAEIFAEKNKAAELKAAQELKVKQEAEVKAALAIKKTTITCIKGKTVKKVSAIKPKCPAGFKKK